MAGNPRESAVVQGTREVLKRKGAFFFKTQSGGYGGMPGLPDFVVCYRGQYLGIECKRASGGKISAAQERVGHAILRAGGGWYVVRSKDEVLQILLDIDNSLLAIQHGLAEAS